MTNSVDGQPASPPAAPAPRRPESGPIPRTADASTAEQPRPRSRKRDPFFDNAKFLAIILVVLGHVAEDLRDIEALHALYMFIYMFHMPVFIVITGYFSRNFTFSGGKAKKLITNLAVPYVVFEVAYSTYHWAVDGAKLEITLLDPYYLTWFLMALFAWRLSAPVWAQIRWPLAVAVVISLLSGMNDLPRELDMNRMLGMLPFFVLGLMLKPEHFEWLKRPRARVVGVLTLLGGVVVAFLTHNRMTTEWAYWRHGNDYLTVDDLTGSAMRLGILVCSSALVAAFLALVPARETWYTNFGSLTLYAYLLHGFFTKLMEYMGWWDAGWMRHPLGLVTVLSVAAGIAIVLMTPPVRWATRWALEPRMPWAFVAPRRPRHSVHQGAHRAPEPRPAPASDQEKDKDYIVEPTGTESRAGKPSSGLVSGIGGQEAEVVIGGPPLPRRPELNSNFTPRAEIEDTAGDGPATAGSDGGTAKDEAAEDETTEDGAAKDRATGSDLNPTKTQPDVRPPYGLSGWPQPRNHNGFKKKKK